MRKNNDNNHTDRSLFAAAGSSNELSMLSNDIARLDGEIKKLRAELATRSVDLDIHENKPL